MKSYDQRESKHQDGKIGLNWMEKRNWKERKKERLERRLLCFDCY